MVENYASLSDEIPGSKNISEWTSGITANNLLIAHRQEYKPLSEDATVCFMHEIADIPVIRHNLFSHQKSSMKLHSF